MVDGAAVTSFVATGSWAAPAIDPWPDLRLDCPFDVPHDSGAVDPVTVCVEASSVTCSGFVTIGREILGLTHGGIGQGKRRRKKASLN